MKKEKKTQVVMLATDKTAPLYLGSKLYNRVGKYNDNLGKDGSVKGQHLYFLSDDKIKEGDNFYNPHTGHLHIAGSHSDLKSINENKCKKVIASTDESLGLPRPSNAFIQKYVEEYNKSNIITEVMVEYERRHIYIPKEEHSIFYQPKTKPDNTIIISAVEETWNDIFSKYQSTIKLGELNKSIGEYLQENYQVPKQINK